MKSKSRVLSCLASLALCVSVTPGFSAMYKSPEYALGRERGLSKLLFESTTNLLLTAINENSIELAKQALTEDPTLAHATFYGGFSALSIAIRHERKEIAALLIEHGADVNSRNVSGITPLYCAAEDGNVEIVKLLMNHKADINAQNSIGRTALHRAVENSDAAMVIALLRLGADVNVRDQFNKTPLDMVGRTYIASSIRSLLLEKGAVGSSHETPSDNIFGAIPATMTKL